MIDIERARSLVNAIWNDGNLDAIDALYAANFVGHDPHNPIQGIAGMKQWVEETRNTMPDFHINLHESIVEGDVGVTRWTASGTHRNEWRGIPATNKTFVVSGMTMSKFDGDKIVESWVNADNLGMLQQLGIVPDMAGEMAE